MSRWDSIVQHLPRFLRDPKLLEYLNALDLSYQPDKSNGHFEIRAHYAGGEVQFVELTDQSRRFPAGKV